MLHLVAFGKSGRFECYTGRLAAPTRHLRLRGRDPGRLHARGRHIRVVQLRGQAERGDCQSVVLHLHQSALVQDNWRQVHVS